MIWVVQIFNYFFSPDRALARQLNAVIGFVPSRLYLYKQAFYHKSMNSNEKMPKTYNNERLEYLGDSVLSTIVAEYLFKKYPNQAEGFLTKMRSKIVKRQTLNEIATKMGLDMILSEYSLGKMSSSMMGNALEALVGAVYLEKGYPFTKRYVINKILRRYLDIHELEQTDDNYKSRLLEHCQKYGMSIEYKLLSKYKQDKRDRFKIGVFVEGKERAKADGYNKKSAEQLASKIALITLQHAVSQE